MIVMSWFFLYFTTEYIKWRVVRSVLVYYRNEVQKKRRVFNVLGPDRYILSGFKWLSFLSSWRFPSSRSYHLEKSMYQLTSFFPLKFQLNSLLAAWCQCILLFEDGMEIVIRAFKDSFTDRVRHSTMSSFHWYTFR